MKQYTDLYEQQRDLICRHSAPAMNALREQAYMDCLRLGFPTRKVERYKYTDVAEAFAPNYGLNLSRLDIPVNPYDAFRCDVPNLSTSLYFMLNDQFYDKALPQVSLPDGVYVGSLRQAFLYAECRMQNAELGNAECKMQNAELGNVECRMQNAELKDESRGEANNSEFCIPNPALNNSALARYGTLARTSKDALTALNTMLAQDGLLIFVPKNTVVERPIQIVNILRADVDLMVNRRVLIVLEDGAQAKLLFCDHAADDRQFLTTQVIEVYVGENAHLEMYELEETHTKNRRFSNLYAQQSAHSTAVFDSITLHNGLTRNRADVTLCGEYAETTMNGLVIADKQQRVDNNTLIDHRAAHCQSNELYKYVLDDEAQCAFAGRVLVREGAQQTVSKETNANLLGSKQARIYTQPMLEIYADDVKCSHGSTVGQLGDQALFYMRQRGIPLPEARTLLKFAFASDVLQTIRLDALRDRLHYLVDKRFRGELSHCEGCKLCK